MIDALLIAACCFLGFSFDVMGKIRGLKKQYPAFSFKEVWGTFAKEEWDSFFISFLIGLSFELALFVVNYTESVLPAWVDKWGMYVIPLIVSYGGQALAYKVLNTTKDALQRKVDDVANKTVA